jgi:2-polyprenyl-6-hydroxyphenyl methylase/3-demethylubiquinone-9 3-methyltransferase
MAVTLSSVKSDEVARFSAQARAWWQPDGPFRFLHAFGPQRLAYIDARVAAWQGSATPTYQGMRVIDIGCGGGLLAEPLAQRGATVVGIDASAASIEVARLHAAETGTAVTYRVATAEELADAGERFDVAVACEIVEHVADLDGFIDSLGRLVRPGGLVLLSSLNRTWKSRVFGVWVAEYLLGWVPPGTHDWRRFQKPSELAARFQQAGFRTRDVTGLVYHPARRTFSLQKGRTAIDYLMTVEKES